MEVITTIGAPNANSYASIEEHNQYLEGRDGFDLAKWYALSDAQKGLRIMFGSRIIDSLRYRGTPATVAQAMQFPRLFPSDRLFTQDMNGSGIPFRDWESLVEFAELYSADVPVIPQDIKYAQIEATFQVVHTHMFNIEAMESGESSIASLSIDVINMTFSKEPKSSYSLFSKSDFGAASTIKLLLQKYMSGLRADLI